MNKKGFVITVDAFLGITLMFVLISMSFFYLSQVTTSAWNDIDSRALVNDEANVLVKSMVLENAVRQSSSELVSSALIKTPSNYCFAVTISNTSDSALVLYAIKAGCVKSSQNIYSSNKLLVVRPVLDSSGISFYLVKIEGWVN